MNNTEQKRLIDLTLSDFADETAGESMAPGGGSISAYVGVLGVSLGTMVANLSAHKPGWDENWETYSMWAEKGQLYQGKLLALVDEDTQAFNKIIEGFRLPKNSKAEKMVRSQAIEAATIYATKVPLEVMKTACESMEVMMEMAKNGLQNSLSDAGVGALCARTVGLRRLFEC